MSTDGPSSVSIQTEASPIPSVPAWFGEVALVAHTLTRQGLLTEISEHVRFSRKRFGTYELIDFLVVLMSRLSVLSFATSPMVWLVSHCSAGGFDVYRYHRCRFGCPTCRPS